MKNSKRRIVSFRHEVHLSKMMCLSTPEDIECMSLDPLCFCYREPHVCYAMYSTDISLTVSVTSKISIKSRQGALDDCEILSLGAWEGLRIYFWSLEEENLGFKKIKIDDRRSTSACVFLCYSGAVYWKSFNYYKFHHGGRVHHCF